MQEGDTRANLAKTGFKHAHYSLGRLCLLYDAAFGIAKDHYRAFGKQAEFLEKAQRNLQSKRLALPIRAATGSINKEVEKQNEMLLLNNLRAHWSQQNQLLQALSSPMMSPMQKDYIWQVFQGSNWVMAKICKDFGFNDPSLAVPQPAGTEAHAMMTSEQSKQQTAQEVGQFIMQSPQQMKQLQQPQPPSGNEPPPGGVQ